MPLARYREIRFFQEKIAFPTAHAAILPQSWAKTP
jgi:hypothetical protein